MANQTVISLTPDYAVYVWGVPITEDVISVSISNSVDNELTTARVVVVNPNQKYIMPTRAVPDTPGTLVAADDTQTPLASVSRDTTSTQSEPVDTLTFARLKRFNMMSLLGGGGALDPNSPLGAAMQDFQSSSMWPFKPGLPLLQAADPIRIFIADPTDPSRQTWYFGFTGFIAAVTEEFDGTSDRSTLTIMAEDIRRILRYMRTSTSPDLFRLNTLPTLIRPTQGGGAIGSLTQTGATGGTTSNDLIRITGNLVLQAGMPLIKTSQNRDPTQQGIIDMLLQGQTTPAQGILQGLPDTGGNTVSQVEGILGFPQGQIVEVFANSGNMEVQLSSLFNQIYPVLTPDEVDAYGRDYSLGALSGVAPRPNNIYVFLPDKSIFGSAYWPYEPGVRIDYYVTFRTRLDIINEYVKNIDTIWWATPAGDIAVMFPTYDADPSKLLEPWRTLAQINMQYLEFQLTEDDRNIKTLTIAQGSPVEGLNPKDFPPIAYGVKFNLELAARYGVRQQFDTRPFKYSDSDYTSSLPALAALWQGLANSDAVRLDGLRIPLSPRLPMVCPYLFVPRNFIGISTGIQHTIVWGQQAMSIVDLRYIRLYNFDKGGYDQISGQFGFSFVSPSPDVTDPTALPSPRQSTPPPSLPQDIRSRWSSMSQQDKAAVKGILRDLQDPQLDADTASDLHTELNNIISKYPPKPGL